MEKKAQLSTIREMLSFMMGLMLITGITTIFATHLKPFSQKFNEQESKKAVRTQLEAMLSIPYNMINNMEEGSSISFIIQPPKSAGAMYTAEFKGDCLRLRLAQSKQDTNCTPHPIMGTSITGTFTSGTKMIINATKTDGKINMNITNYYVTTWVRCSKDNLMPCKRDECEALGGYWCNICKEKPEDCGFCGQQGVICNDANPCTKNRCTEGTCNFDESYEDGYTLTTGEKCCEGKAIDEDGCCNDLDCGTGLVCHENDCRDPDFLGGEKCENPWKWEGGDIEYPGTITTFDGTPSEFDAEGNLIEGEGNLGNFNKPAAYCSLAKDTNKEKHIDVLSLYKTNTDAEESCITNTTFDEPLTAPSKGDVSLWVSTTDCTSISATYLFETEEEPIIGIVLGLNGKIVSLEDTESPLTECTNKWYFINMSFDLDEGKYELTLNDNTHKTGELQSVSSITGLGILSTLTDTNRFYADAITFSWDMPQDTKPNAPPCCGDDEAEDNWESDTNICSNGDLQT